MLECTMDLAQIKILEIPREISKAYSYVQIEKWGTLLFLPYLGLEVFASALCAAIVNLLDRSSFIQVRRRHVLTYSSSTTKSSSSTTHRGLYTSSTIASPPPALASLLQMKGKRTAIQSVTAIYLLF